MQAEPGSIEEACDRMEPLYENLWADQGCAGATLSVVAISLALVFATLGAILLVARMAMRRAAVDAAAPRERDLRLVLGAIGLGLVGLVLWTALGGETMHRAALGPDGGVFNYCDGPFARRETVAPEAIGSIAHRLVVRRRRNGSPHYDDFAVVALVDGREHAIPLRVDPERSPPDALRRRLPAEVLEDWANSLRDRGEATPEAYFER